ncbi:hypothetical protein FB446DRAFT_291504 [Lentinula raphanica]|nr:hypothetical protein FB446DRAFT_291504 [Lentinula raphanica]
MRYLTSTRTPSVRLYAYLLLFFGCATNLYTAALPVTEPDSGLAAPSASALVPRDGTLVRVEWKNDNEQATGLTSDERWNDFTMKCLQNVIETNLGKQWSDGKKVGQFLGKPMWNKWQQKDSDGDSEHPAATAYFQYLLVNSYEYGQVLAKQLQFRSEYYFTRYKSVQAEKVGEPFSISLQHTYVVRTSRRVNEQGSHAQAYKDAIVDSFNEFFGPFPSIQPTNDRQPKLGREAQL